MQTMKILLILILSLNFISCESYNKSVSARSIGLSGYTEKDQAGGKIIYRVEYR